MDQKRTEKLASALYLITSFFNDLEPMKWRLRELGGKLVSERGNQTIIEEIKGLLNVSKNVGLISDVNHSIIYKELGASALPTIEQVLKIDPTEEKERLSDKIYISSTVAKTPFIRDKVTPMTNLPKRDIQPKKSDRQEIILSLVRKRGEVMIKDVTPLIEGVSEKTIQRELLSLVSRGILSKVGEKRWSRYRLAEEH